MTSFKRLIGFVSGLLFSCSVGCLAAQTAAPSKFETTVASIEKQVVDLAAIGDLSKSKDFVTIYSKPKTYYADAISLLKNPGVSDQRKMITVYSMGQLAYQDYLRFLNDLLFLYRKGLISYHVYVSGAFPMVEWNTVLQDHYQDPAVQAFLSLAKAAAATKEDKSYIDSILSGEAARHVADRRTDRTLPPPRSGQ